MTTPRKERCLPTTRPRWPDQLAIGSPSGMFVSTRTADHFSLYHLEDYSQEALHAVDIGLDYRDAANEDAHGRLPLDKHYGLPVALARPVPHRLPIPTEKAGVA